MGVPAAGRPRRSTRADVVTAAVAVLGEVGIDGITMQRVAGRLGRGRTSVYHHFPNGLRELQAAVVERVVTTADPSIRVQTSEPQLEQSLGVLARLTADYPDLVAYMLTAGRDESVSLAGGDRIVRQLEACGFGEAVPEAFLAVNAFATGWAFMRQATPDVARAAGCGALASATEDAAGLSREELLVRGIRWLLAGMQADLAVQAGSSKEPTPRDRVSS